MPLRVLAGPGCDDVGKNAYVAEHAAEGDVVISVGRIFSALTGSADVPSSNPPVLRLALGLRAVAIRSAREKELNGWVLTSNGSRADLDRLAADAGAVEIDVLTISKAEACARVRRVTRSADRTAACLEGVATRWFGRYQPGPSDHEVDP